MHRDASGFDVTTPNGPSHLPVPAPTRLADPTFEALFEEQRRLWRAGTPILVADYLARHPALRGVPEDAATLIYQEFVLRQAQGEPVNLAEYIERFDDCASELRRLHEADQFVNTLFATPARPKRAGDYELYEELGRGGAGIVYRAWHPGLQRVVALKMLLAGELASPAGVERFCNEARVAAQLQHPGIVAIHDVGAHEGRHFFVMDFVPGKNLAELVRDGPLAPARAATYVRAVADAIHYAHAQGILHRDLKPSNILIDRGDRPRITDFGLARWQSSARLTVTGQVLGTPAYMSPEQASGQGGQVSAASDIYALGAVLYELMTGRPTVTAETPFGAIRQVLETEPVAPHLLRPGVPRDLETICLKCLEREPNRRYATAAALADDLGRFLRQETILARPIGNPGRLWRSCRRNPLLAGLMAGAAVSLVAGTCTSTYFAVQADRRTDDAVREQKWARAAQRDAAHRRYVADMRLAARAWDENQVPWLLDLLDSHRPKNDRDTDRRGFEWHYLHNLCHSARFLLQGHGGTRSAVACSPDGKRLATGGADGLVRIWDAATGERLHEFSLGGGGAVQSVAFSPDGQRLAGGGNSTVDLWDVSSGRPLRSFPAHGEPVASLAFSPDGGTLATAGMVGKIALWDAATGRSTGTRPAGKGRVEVVAYNPQGSRLAAAGTDGTVTVWDLAARTPPLILSGYRPGHQALAFRPDGELLAFGRENDAIAIWNVASGKELPAIVGHTGLVTALAFSPQGWLASASFDQTVRGWDPATGRPIHLLRGHCGYVYCLAITPDGKQLVSGGADNTGRVWDLTRSQESLSLAGHSAETNAVVFSADGQRLFSAGDDGAVCIWDTASNLKLATLGGHRGRVFALAISRDGRCLATAGEDASVRVWTTDGNCLKQTLEGHSGTVWAAAFSPDGARLATSGADGTVRLWDPQCGRNLCTLKGHAAPVSGIAFSPDGRHLASASWDYSIRIWNAADGQQLRTLRVEGDPVWRVAYSPDGERLASVGSRGMVRLWDIGQGEVLRTLRGHTADVSGVAFSPDGTRVASSGWDGTVRVWEAARGDELLVLKCQTSRAFAVAFSADGHRLAATTRTGAVQIWDARPRVLPR